MKKEALIKFIEHKAYAIRCWSIAMTAKAGSGHPTSALSATDIVAVIFFYAMRFDPYNYENPDNDRFILSKGHAVPVLYAVWHELGLISDAELMTYRQSDSVLEGHPTRRCVYVEAATGSLGIGLSVGVGEALNAQLDKRYYRTYVVMGDSESSEGSVWEAAQLAAHYKCDNLICFIDVNNLGQSTETMLDYEIKKYVDMSTSFGWHAIAVDGHNVEALMRAVDEAHCVDDKPIMIIAKTIKGYGVDLVAGREGFHGKALTGEQEKIALQQLQKNFSAAASFDENSLQWKPMHPHQSEVKHRGPCEVIMMPRSEYTKGEMIATRRAYGLSLAHVGDVCDSVISLDAEVKNSTHADIFESVYPSRFFQCFVAEQNMIGMGIGFDRRGKIPFISTFSSFFSRAHDQVRMAAVGQSALRLVGSHCGVSIGQDGPSQMGLEDIALMRCMPKSVVLYPCDAVSTHKLVEQMARYDKGISYLRTTRMATPVIYENSEQFPIGGCKVLKKSENDVACIVGAGVTVFEALKAYEILSKQNIFVSVVDLYSIKPLDASGVKSVALSSRNTIIVVEDHYPEGGICEAVRSALAENISADGSSGIKIYSLAVKQLPRSGKPEELLAMACIDADAIVALVKGID